MATSPRARTSSLFTSADLGSMARAMSSDGSPETQFACPFPKSWYPEGSPCSKTDDVFTGPTQDSWYTPAESGSGWLDFSGLTGPTKTVFWVGVGLVGFWLLTRSVEAYGALRRV